MNNCYIAKLFIFIIFFVLAGCSVNQSKPEYNKNVKQNKLCFFPDNTSESAPSWVCGTKQDDLHSYTIIKVQKSNDPINNLKSKIEVNAKIVLLQQIRTYISNKTKNYIESNNLGGVEKFIKISSIIISNTSVTALDNNVKIQYAISKNRTIYVLAGLTKKSYKNTLKAILEKTLQNNKQDLEYSGIDDKTYDQLTKVILYG